MITKDEFAIETRKILDGCGVLISRPTLERMIEKLYAMSIEKIGFQGAHLSRPGVDTALDLPFGDHNA